MALLIDSSVFISLERSGQAPTALLDRLGEESLALAAITASELLHGVHRADSALRRSRREAFVEAVLGAIPILTFTLEVARTHALLWADMERSGTIIGTHDLLIAATALTFDLTVVTGNGRHFGRVEGLKMNLW